MDANFSFSKELATILIPFLVIMLVLAAVFCVLVWNDRKIMKARLDLAQAILTDSLDDLLQVFRRVPCDVFDDPGINFRTTDFLAAKLNKESFPKIYSAYRNLDCFCRQEVWRIFEQAFSKKKNAFWVRIYIADFISSNGERADDFQNFFEIFEDSCFTEIWTNISMDLKNYEDHMLHASNQELAERISAELNRIKILLG